MHAINKRIVVPAAIVIALLAAPALSGCSVKNLVHNATGGKVDLGGKQVPSDFPSEVPLVKGDVLLGASVKGDNGDKVWNVTIKASAATTFDEIKSEFEGAGFETGDIGGQTDGAGTATFTNGTYSAAVVFAKNDKGDRVANYTVTNITK
jgi:hypothetical protein